MDTLVINTSKAAVKVGVGNVCKPLGEFTQSELQLLLNEGLKANDKGIINMFTFPTGVAPSLTSVQETVVANAIDQLKTVAPGQMTFKK